MVMVGTLPGLVQRSVYATEIDHNNWIDWSLPRSVSVAPFEGERYEAEVPDTIDLVDNANYALNMATRLWVPEWGYELLNSTDMSTNPPKFSMGSGGLLTESAKIVEAMPMLRIMTGSTYNIDMDDKAMMSFVRVTGKDGLCYYPVENRPWAFFDDYTKTIGEPYSDIFAEGRQLLAYASWYEHDKNPLWKKLAEKKTRRLLEMTLKKNGTFYFRLLRGYTPWDDPKKGEVVPVGDHNVYDKSKGMVGTPAACIVGWIPQAGGIWYRLTKEECFRKLSEGLAEYLYRYGEMIDPNTGAYLADHETHITHSLLSNLSWSLTFGDKQMAQWVKRGYDFHVPFIDPCQVGILFDQEACMVSDTIGIGIMLTQAGMGDYWEEVDRLIRNTYLDMQVTNVKWLKSQPFKYRDDLEPGDYQYEDGADRCVGVWRQYLNKDYKEAAGCCNGNCSRELYYVWKNILTDNNDVLRVNLLYNRVSVWADVDSWLPYEGRVVVNMKIARDALLVRVPEWVDQHKVECKINGEKRKVAWSGNYLNAGAVKRGDKVSVEFPMERRTVDATIPVLLQREGEEETWQRKKCTVTLKGNTVIGLEPSLEYPLAEHEKYMADKAPMKKVIRFVSKERFLF
jgi:hypothetical protein